MDKLKYGVLVSALAGLVGCFLPIMSDLGTFWDLRKVDQVQTLLVMAGYVLPLVVAVLSIVRPPILRIHAILATFGFIWTVTKLRDNIAELVKAGAIGGRLMTIAPMVGLLFAIGALVWAPKSPR
jgi:hypothetical protein